MQLEDGFSKICDPENLGIDVISVILHVKVAEI